MKLKVSDVQSILQQISDVLLINGGFLNNPGLYTGEMGLVLFFTRFARYTQNDLYQDYAYDLIKKIQEKIHRDTPVNYKQGLSGIGSAIEYLVQNDFFEADTDEILEDIDKRIFFTYNLPGLLIDEIIDIGYYVNWRMSGNSSRKDIIRKNVLPQVKKILINQSVNPDMFELCRIETPDGFLEKTSCHCLEHISKDNFWVNMSLQSGLAGWGMSLLTELDKDDSWYCLLPNKLLIPF